MKENLFGTERVAVVKDEGDQSQDRMHLDCVFSILSNDTVILLSDIQVILQTTASCTISTVFLFSTQIYF